MTVVPWINNGEHVGGLKIAECERVYKAKYVADLSIQNRNGNWTDRPVAVFYQQSPNFELGHNYYFGLYITEGNVFITSAMSAAEHEWFGVQAPDGEIIFSRWNHDFRTSGDGTVFTDGGPIYGRYGGEGIENGGKTINLKIVDGEFQIVRDVAEVSA